MKLPERLRGLNTQTWCMIAAIVMLFILIASRWSYISHAAGTAFRDRFTPQTEQTDTVHPPGTPQQQ